MARVFFYKMTDDSGLAPCVDGGLLTLAVCKPGIREHAEEEDVILGFGDKKKLGERLIFVARVTDKLRGGEYYRTRLHQDRRDCIYEDRDGRACHRRDRRVPGHDTRKALLHDVGERFERGDVLLSSRGNFQYFGKDGTKDYCDKHQELAKEVSSSGCRPYRVDHARQLQGELALLIGELLPPGYAGREPGNPSDSWPDDCGGCGRAPKPKRPRSCRS